MYECHETSASPKNTKNVIGITPDQILDEVGKRNNPTIQIHSGRVANIALALSKGSDNTDKDAIIHGSLFHDIMYKEDFSNHAEKGAKLFVKDYAQYYNHRIAEIIRNAIASHSIHSTESENSLEAAIVNDADKIDWVASLIPTMYTKTLEKLKDPLKAEEDCRSQIIRLLNNVVTEKGREVFIKTLEEQKQIHPWLGLLPVIYFKNFELL